MTFKSADRVKVYTPSSGLADLNVGSTFFSAQSFDDAGFIAGDECVVVIADLATGDWETCEAIYRTAPNRIERGTLLDSSTGSRINFTGNASTTISVVVDSRGHFMPGNFTEGSIYFADTNGVWRQGNISWDEASSTLLVYGTNPALRIAEDGDTSNYIEILDWADSYAEFRKINSAGDARLGFSPAATNGTGAQTIEFFGGSPASSGASTIKVEIPNSAMVNAQIGASDGPNTYFCQYYGDFGIGISNPDSRFHVHRDSAGAITALVGTVATIEGGGTQDAYLSILHADAYSGGIIIGQPADNDRTKILSSSAKTSIARGGTDVITIDNMGAVGIGTDSPDSKLHIHSATAGTISAASSTILTIENSGNAYVNFLTPASGSQGLLFGDPGDNDIGYIKYHHSNDTLKMRSASGSFLGIAIHGDGVVINSDNAPDAALHVYDNILGAGSVTANPNSLIVAEGSANSYISLLTPDGYSSGIYFGDVSNASQASVAYDHASDTYTITTAGVANINISTTGIRVGSGSQNADARLHAHVDAAGAVPCLELHQADADQAFIKFNGTSATDLSQPVTSRISGMVSKRFARVNHNGTTYYTPLFSAPLSTDDCDPKGADPFCMGRLTLTSGTPYPVSDVTSSLVYFAPIGAGIIHLYDSTEGRWLPRKFTQASLSLSGMTVGYGQDVFAYWNSGSLALERVEWASATARATALGTQNGVYVKSGLPERLYVGSFRAQSATDTTFSKARRMVWNMYNRRRYPLKQLNAGGSATMSTTGYRGMGNSTANVIAEVFCGLQEGTVSLTATSVISNASGNNAGWIGIGEDSTSPHADCALGRWNTNNDSNDLTPGRPAFLNTIPSSIGWHYYLGVESQDLSSPTCTHAFGYMNGSWEC